MVVQDLNFLFEILDTDARGFLSLDDIQLFEETTYFDALDLEQIKAAFATVCHDHARCSKASFTPLLKELERRRSLEEKIKWDFKALDNDCDNRISLQAASFLFKSVHVQKMSITHWNMFLSSRIRPEDEVSFHEMKMFLCNIPVQDPSDNEDYSLFSRQLSQGQIDRGYLLHESLFAMQVHSLYVFCIIILYLYAPCGTHR